MHNFDHKHKPFPFIAHVKVLTIFYFRHNTLYKPVQRIFVMFSIVLNYSTFITTTTTISSTTITNTTTNNNNNNYKRIIKNYLIF